MSVQIAIALIDLVVVTVLIVRRVDVRLVLLAAAVPLFAVSGGLKLMLTKLVAEMANRGTVVPICTALGFAYVLRITECDQHLIRLLLRPLRHVRWLLIPGGISAGYLVNTTIVSQTGTAAVLGPILIPLLRAGGVQPAAAGAILLLGSSMGGELFNPGAVEMRKLAELTGLSGPEVVARSTAQNLLACGTALLSFWALAQFRGRRKPVPGALERQPRPRPSRQEARSISRSTLSRPSFPCCRWCCCSPTRAWGLFPRCEPWKAPPRFWPRCSSASSWRA